MHGMKQVTVKKVIRRKLDHWISNLPDELQELAKENVLVCGGAISSMLSGESPSDYDVYFRTKDAAKIFAIHYVGVFNSTAKITSKVRMINPEVKEEVIVNCKGEKEERIVFRIQSAGIVSENSTGYDYFESRPEHEATEFVDGTFEAEEQGLLDNVNSDELLDNALNDALVSDPASFIEPIIEDLKPKKDVYRPVFLSDNAVTLSDKIQLIIRFYGEPEEIHKNFDFVHCMTCYDYRKDTLTMHDKTLENILSKSLVYNGSLYPIASLFRIRKFIKRGWRITAGQMLRIIYQVSKLDLNHMPTLREQLLGVDQAYMLQLIDLLKEHQKQYGKIDEIYLAKVIDELFE